MAKQLTCQKYIFKIRSSRLRKARWNLTLPLTEARMNEEIISLADSQVLRWLDELNGIEDADQKARDIKRQIKKLRKEDSSITNKRKIRSLYDELDKVQFKPDYMCLIIDREKDYRRACKGFSINGVKYRRLLGTNGGVKNETIVFISERHGDEIIKRIENGRDPNKALVPAKLEAYKALTCSASIPVSLPNGILIVPDCETKFVTDIVSLNDEGVDEPVMETQYGVEVEMDASDGFGLILPSLAKRWSEELGLDYVASGMNTRFSFEKGMVFTFNFMEFADKIAQSYLVKDAWGDIVDIRKVEMILTTSMVKLWDSYKSCDDYIKHSLSNHYTFGITKTCPKELENERALNYQFIQSYDLTDDEIEELIRPTMDEIYDVLGGDVRKSILFLKGKYMNDDNVDYIADDFVKALMIDERMINDPYVKQRIYWAIKNRINEAKVGVLNVRGNYSIISGDPFSLCQSIFGLEVTGLLKAGEVYNQYWDVAGAEKCACFRAPMTCHANIRIVEIARSDEVRHWFQYMKTCTILNSWDTITAALNGADMDGDLVMLTDNRILVEKHKKQPALMCAQRRAEKKVVTEEDLIQSNINSFGDEIGKTTNWITSMFEVRAQYKKGSPEYEVLDYRIKCGQLYQQNSIDKAKGIICKPMPRYWHDRHAVNQIEDIEERRFALSIVADRKPYFMRLIYPDLMRRYNKYITNTNKSCLREFGCSIKELQDIPEEERTERQSDFLRYYNVSMPVGLNDCVMNKICRRFESTFDKFLQRKETITDFDYSIMKCDSKYDKNQYYAIMSLFESYNNRLKNYVDFTRYEIVDDYEMTDTINQLEDEFRRSCYSICSNEKALCNIILDMCYRKKSTKRFVWTMCQDVIIENLLEKNNYHINYPVMDESGEVIYGGDRFSFHIKTITEDYNEYCS